MHQQVSTCLADPSIVRAFMVRVLPHALHGPYARAHSNTFSEPCGPAGYPPMRLARARSFVFGSTIRLWSMSPKVRSASTPPDSMATQPDSPAEVRPEEVPQTQCVPEPDAPQTKKRGRPRGKASSSDANKNRATRAPLLKHVISKKTLVHPHVIQKVLCELEDVCVEQINATPISLDEVLYRRDHGQQ